MAVSELHSRLEHLVSYSSQLIFVSGDTIGEQQQSLQAFMGQQSETAEIAFINAKVDTYEQQYRRQISRQLLGDESGLFNRPLNELLASLNHYDGPVLICICQAELLPPSFLQELWDLVLQCRFANNKQHLNVILFGKSAWAEQAKAWLPAKNRDKPVLLSNESITESTRSESALDKLIADKRQKFEERLIARAQPKTTELNALNKWWFRGMLALAFLATFSGLLLWQYSDAIPDIWSTASTTPTVQTQSTPIASNTELPVKQEAAVEIIDAPMEDDAGDMFLDQHLVTDWQTEVAEISNIQDGPESAADNSQVDIAVLPNSAEQTETTSAEAALPENEKTTLQALQANPTTQPDPAEETDSVGETQVDDYPVEDIVSISQLPGETPESLPLSISDLEQLNALADSDFVIQIAGISSQQVVDEFLRDNNLNEQVWIYTTQRFGGDWHVILQRQSYSSLELARAALVGLPDNMQTGTPFVKSMRQTKSEIAQQ